MALDHDSVTGKAYILNIPDALLDIVLRERIVPLEALLVANGLRFLGLDDDIVSLDLAAVAFDYLQCLGERIISGFVHGDVGIDERNILDFIQRLLPEFRNIAVPYHTPEDTSGGCRVAVGILAAAGGYIDCLVEILLAVKQSDDDVSAVDHSVDVERRIDSVRAARVVSILAGEERPGGLPVLRILLVPLEDIRNSFVLFTLCINGLARLRNHILDVVVIQG